MEHTESQKNGKALTPEHLVSRLESARAFVEDAIHDVGLIIAREHGGPDLKDAREGVDVGERAASANYTLTALLLEVRSLQDDAEGAGKSPASTPAPAVTDGAWMREGVAKHAEEVADSLQEYLGDLARELDMAASPQIREDERIEEVQSALRSLACLMTVAQEARILAKNARHALSLEKDEPASHAAE